jgi:hypothetical protein
MERRTAVVRKALQQLHLDTGTNVGRVEAAGARAVPARSIVDCAVGVELIARALALHSCCEPGTARAPVVDLRCTPLQQVVFIAIQLLFGSKKTA